jgi:NitT/TauT family transport system substrate-binding protein
MKSTVLAAIAVVIIAIVVGGAVLASGALSAHTTTVTSSQPGTTVTSVSMLTTTATTIASASLATTVTSVSMVTTTASTSSVMSSSNSSTSSNSTNSINLIRIGYFANLNHAPAILGLSDGDFQSYLGPTTTIKTYLFTAGPTEMTALLAGQLDMAYVGPSPAVNSFIQSNGTALRIVAGVSGGGAVFVVRNNDGITSVANFTGKTFAAPQLGNTQDIALRSYLLRNHYVVGTNVTVVDTSNSNILTLMTQGKIDGAWVPEPTASQLIFQANCHVFLDERSLWPGGNFSTAELVVSTSFLNAHPDVVKKIIEADVNDTMWIDSNPAKAATLIDDRIANLTSTTATNSTIFNNATQYLTFTYDPLEASVAQQAQNAYELGFLGTTAPNLNGLFNLTLLNEVLQQDGLAQVTN